ncbi:MAG: TonB-dependent receptor, partial [Chitinophagaceae bacterium]|nr:TonB-dependent receptor [Chitinophagaceae bacterium]
MVAFAQSITIKGKVTDDKAEPLPNASVLVKGTSNGVTTGEDGSFSINVPNTRAVLVITAIGHQRQEITVGNQKEIEVVLAVGEASELESVVVVGYATQKKVTVTGAVAQVKGSDLDKSPSINLSNSLAGRLPGITAVQSSGEPGYDGSSIRIRGVNSFGNSDALIVIDGVPNRAGGLERLNPADIESVSVLKDAAAAIYGSRAGNGVILITTKRGKTGKPTISYDFNYGIAQPTRVPKMSDAPEYATIRNELIIYDNVPSAEWENAFNAFKSSGTYTTLDGRAVNAVFTQDEITKFGNGSEPLKYPNTDWYKSVLKTWSPQTTQNIQLTGGSERIKYMGSLGYTDQDGYYKNSATGYRQYDLRLNVDAKVNDYITTSIGVAAREEFRHFPNGGGAGDIFRMLMRGKPTEIALWPNGLPGPDIENGQNPAVITTNQTGYINDKRDYFQTNGKLEIIIPGIEGLKVTGIASVDKRMTRMKNWAKPWTLYYWDGSSMEADGKTPALTGSVRSTFTDPRLKETSSQELAVNLTGMINYDHTFGSDHAFNVMAGVTREKVDADGFDAFRRYFISPAIEQLFAGASLSQDITNGNYLYQRARLSYIGRVGYNFKEKYIAEFLWRYDGSYMFPEDKRFGFFPGVSAGWRISEEGFFRDNIRFIDNLKLRASWGQMGAEPYINGGYLEYAFLSTMGFDSYIINDQVAKTLYESRVPNLGFTWEKANNANIGLDAGFLNNKLTLEFDYFYNKRSDILQLLTGSIPQSSGVTDILPPVNYGKMSNKGWEFKLSYNNRIGDLIYNASVNGGYARNKIIDWNETPGLPEYQKTTGRALNGFLMYQYDGIFTSLKDIADNTIDYSKITGNLLPGDMKFKDVNNDGKIDADDQVRSDRTNIPRFTGGLNIGLQY